MKVNFKGDFLSEDGMVSAVEEVVNKMAEKLGVEEGTQIKVCDVEFKVKFINGDKETYASIERQVGDTTINEMFTVGVNLTETGEIEDIKDNEEKSFYDDYTLATAAGTEYKYEGIKSGFSDEELEIIDTVETCETGPKKVRAVKYRIKNSEKELIRNYKGEKLVSEIVLEPKEVI